MFCRNCGNELNENAVVCVNCGVGKGIGKSYCPNCGKETNADAVVCLSCGCSLEVKGKSTKSKIVAGLLGIFVGALGIHNFYLGYTTKAVIQLLITILGSFVFVGPFISSIWGFIEGVLILVGKIKVDGKGDLLKD